MPFQWWEHFVLNIYLHGAPLLPLTQGLDALKTVGGQLYLKGNGEMMGLGGGLAALESVGSAVLTNNGNTQVSGRVARGGTGECGVGGADQQREHTGKCGIAGSLPMHCWPGGVSACLPGKTSADLGGIGPPGPCLPGKTLACTKRPPQLRPAQGRMVIWGDLRTYFLTPRPPLPCHMQLALPSGPPFLLPWPWGLYRDCWPPH